MSDDKGFQSMWIPLIIFVALGAAVVGVESVAQPVQYVGIESGCMDYTRDNGDNDGYYSLIDDSDCHKYPYSDGLGENPTPIGLGGQSSDQYQPYFDLTVDFVRTFVNVECGGNLAGCIGTNYEWESQFYCYFSNYEMRDNFQVIFSNFWRTNPNMYGMSDDGSENAYIGLCNQLTSPTGNIPTIEHQNTDPLPQNEGGEGGKPGLRPR